MFRLVVTNIYSIFKIIQTHYYRNVQTRCFQTQTRYSEISRRRYCRYIYSINEAEKVLQMKFSGRESIANIEIAEVRADRHARYYSFFIFIGKNQNGYICSCFTKATYQSQPFPCLMIMCQLVPSLRLFPF